MLLRLVEQAGLLLEDAQRLDVRGHVPRDLQVRGLAYEVAGDSARQLARAKHQHLAARRVAAHMPEVNPRQDLRVAVQQLDELVSVGQGSEVIRDVAGAAAYIRMQREIPFTSLDEVPRALEGQLQAAVGVTSRQPARMVPMQVGRHDGIDLFGPDAQPLEREQQAVRLAEADLPGALLAELVADPGLADDDPPVLARDQADACAVDHVVAVGGLLFLPKDLGHHAEHQASVRLPVVGDQQV